MPTVDLLRLLTELLRRQAEQEQKDREELDAKRPVYDQAMLLRRKVLRAKYRREARASGEVMRKRTKNRIGQTAMRDAKRLVEAELAGALLVPSRSRTPWEATLPRLFCAMTVALRDEFSSEERLRQEYDTSGESGEPTDDECALRVHLTRISLGGPSETSRLAAELARLNEAGFGDRLVASLRSEFPAEEVQAILNASQDAVAPPVDATAGDVVASGAAGPTALDEARRQREVVNLFQRDGEVWRVRYEEDQEPKTFQDRKDSALRHLTRLMAAPRRKHGVEAFFPPPPGGSPLPSYGRDADSDETAMRAYEAKLWQLAKEIKEAEHDQDAHTAGRLREEFKALTNHVNSEKPARKIGRRKQSGAKSPREKAGHALNTALRRLYERFREAGLPNLAGHLDRYIRHEGGEWWYEPPPETSLWHVITENPSKNGNCAPGAQ
jgi:hypothetical protein